MKSTLIAPLAGICVCAFLWTGSTAHAQMRAFARYKGEMLPLLALNRDYYFVLEEGRKRRTPKGDSEIRGWTEFGEGFVEISNVRADHDPLRDASIKERASPSAINFTYEADVTSDRDLRGCFGILTLVTDGSIATHFFDIGNLRAGRPRHLDMGLITRVDSVGALHVFSDTYEIRSSQTPDAYDLMEHYAALLGESRGLSAVELFRSERIFPHVLSRDGRYLATTRDRDTHRSLIAYDLETMQLLCDVQIGEHDDYVRDVTWVSDNEIAFISDEKLMLLDVANRTYETLKNDTYGIVGSQKSNPDVLVLLSYRPRVGTFNSNFDVRSRRVLAFEDMGYGYTMFDDDGESRVRYDYVHDGKRYFFKPTANSRWLEMDKQVNERGLYFSLKGRDILDRVADIHSIGPDGDILYISTRQNSDKFKLAAFSMSEGVVKKIIAEHPDYDLTTNDGSISRLLFRKSSSELIGLIYEADKPRVVWLDSGFTRVQEAMGNAFPDHVSLPVDWSDDGSTFIFYTYSDRDPGSYLVFRPLEGKLIPVLRMSDRLKDKAMAETRAIRFQSRDGETIHGYVTEPPDQGEEPAPLIVDIHGGPTVRDGWRFSASNQFLATRGYVVLQVNYRGSSGFGARYQNAGLRARLDTVVIDDIVDGVRHLIDSGTVDADRVGVMGASFGGWASYICLSKHPELFRAGVAISAVSHWRKSLKDDRWKFDNKLGYSFWKAVLDHRNFKEEEPFIDPLLLADTIKQPVYIMHGERDKVVHPREARLMLNALQKHNPKVESLSFPFSSHSSWPLADRIRRMNEIGSFFERHLAPRKSKH